MHNNKIFFFLLLFVSCNNVAVEDQLIGNYYLVATDTKEDLGLCYRAKSSVYRVIVDHTVFAAGFNDKYIIVKQHPRNWPDKMDKSITNYFIVPIYVKNTFHPENGIIGPLSKNEFITEMRKLNLLNKIQFTKSYKSLE